MLSYPTRKDGAELQGPRSAPPSSITASCRSSGSPRTAAEPWPRPGRAGAPRGRGPPPGSDPALMDEASGPGRPSLPPSSRRVDPCGKPNKHLKSPPPHTHMQLDTDLVRDHTSCLPVGGCERRKVLMMKYADCPLIDWEQGP